MLKTYIKQQKQKIRSCSVFVTKSGKPLDSILRPETRNIMGNVELRIYNSPLRDCAIFVSDDCSTVTVKPVMEENTSFNWLVCDGEGIIKSGTASGDFSFGTEGFFFWSPENPKLYTLTITCGDATLERNFGKKLRCKKACGKWCTFQA